MKNNLKLSLIIAISLSLGSSSLKSQSGTINLHYLGHASFVIDYNIYNILTDFGTSYCWGYDSPIYDIGNLIPTVLSYSHYHADHYNEDRVPPYVPYTIDLLDTLNIMDLWIYPVRTCETSPAIESNTSFIFDYMGYKICHLGDAQAEIMNIADPDQQAVILEKFPFRIDVLLMTIQGIYSFIPEAEMFIDLLQPGIVVPIHYWWPGYKEDFLSYLELQNDTAGKSYEVHRMQGPGLELMVEDTIHENIKVFGLSPFPYGETKISTKSIFNPEIHIYPNPCIDRVNVSFTLPEREMVHCSLYDVSGKQIWHKIHHVNTPGRNAIELDLSTFPAGIYFIQLNSPNLGHRNAYVLHRSR